MSGQITQADLDRQRRRAKGMRSLAATKPSLPRRCLAGIRAALGVIAYTIAGSAVGAAGAALFGFLFGVVDGLMSGDLARVVPAIVYFSACGALAGAVAGAFVRTLDPEGSADLTGRIPAKKRRRGAGTNRTLLCWLYGQRRSADDGPTGGAPSLN